MDRSSQRTSKRKTALLVLSFYCLCALFSPSPVNAAETPFSGMSGWWSGEGRIGFKDKNAEKVLCRVTYFTSNEDKDLEQNLRCSTQSFKVEVKSNLHLDDGKITGKWHEKVYDVSGDITGKATDHGLTLFVRGGELTANMHLVTRDNKQIVEIHFQGIDVIGVSILLKKSTAS